MTEAKRRTFIDVTYINLCHEVDPVKKRTFDGWFGSLQPKQTTLLDARELFKIVMQNGAWLTDNARRYSISFDHPGRVILSWMFMNAIDVEYMTRQADPTTYMFQITCKNT